MAYDPEPGALPTEVFKALGDPIRWSIVTQMAAVPELPCLLLEDLLPVSKPTISYHTKILHHAGLISVRKEGRNYFYTLRRDVLHQVLDTLWELAPTPRPIVGKQKGYIPSATRQPDALGRTATGRSRTRAAGARSAGAGSAARHPAAESGEEAVVLTW
jgi:DNA-binding transcriptional ArsR family regulator